MTPETGNRRAVIRRNISGAPQGAMGLNNNRPLGGGQKRPSTPPPGRPQTPLPWDGAAANDEAGAGRRLANTVTGLQAGWVRTQQDFGLEGSWADPASNPYSRATLLQRSYDNARRGTTNSAGNQLYAGSFINAQNQNTHQFNLGRDELQKSYAEAQARNLAEQQQAQDEYGESIVNAGWDRVNAGLESEPEPMPAQRKGGKPQSRRAVIRQTIQQPRRRR